MANRPNLYVIAGPNGAGKTTFARRFLPEFAHCPNFVNVDMIATGLSPFNPETAAIAAGKLMLEKIHALAKGRETFGFETTLSGQGYLRMLQQLKTKGYVLSLFFLWLPNVEMAIQRVKERVRLGGHSVEDEDIRRRFSRGLINLRLYRDIFDQWQIINGALNPPISLAYGKADLWVCQDEALSATLIKMVNG